ncbi:MAG: aminotransferase class I/II-fold pyridoxal phosphate-dependent enzyme [Elusimicrobiota bacterium]|jgi:8-amino-7-oxononanoate synthase|nr:aminotransferase class I/II-fold pyridoxal phosphate-dependent enzyme [Elusimicrobiota bacterium]
MAGKGIFEKCYNFTRSEELKKIGFYPYFQRVESAQGPEVLIDGVKKIVVCSNNYLGLANHPAIIEASCEAAKKYGTSCTGSRYLNGTNDLHEKVEQKFASFIGKEQAILFTTGHHANLGALTSLAVKGDILLTDKLDHASIIDGALLSFGTMLRFKHNDMDDLERLLINTQGKSSLIVVDGVFSMEGDICNLPKIVELAKKYNAGVFVDEAHSLGVLGEGGQGTGQHFHLQPEVDVVMATASKSLASIGGFIAAKKEIIQYIKHTARSLIFTASLPPACVGAIDKAIDLMIAEPERRIRLLEISKRMAAEFKGMGYNIGLSQTPIIPLAIGSDEKAFLMWRKLFDAGVFVSPVVSPAVAEGHAIIRTSFMATHSEEDLEIILESFRKIGKELGVIQ